MIISGLSPKPPVTNHNGITGNMGSLAALIRRHNTGYATVFFNDFFGGGFQQHLSTQLPGLARSRFIIEEAARGPVRFFRLDNVPGGFGFGK